MANWNPYNWTGGTFNNVNVNNLFQDNMIKVNGIAGANAYNMGASQRVALFDENNDVFYVKTTDGAGFPTIRTFKFEEVCQESGSNFVTKDEYNKGINELKELINNGFESVRKQSSNTGDNEG